MKLRQKLESCTCEDAVVRQKGSKTVLGTWRYLFVGGPIGGHDGYAHPPPSSPAPHRAGPAPNAQVHDPQQTRALLPLPAGARELHEADKGFLHREGALREDSSGFWNRARHRECIHGSTTVHSAPVQTAVCIYSASQDSIMQSSSNGQTIGMQ